MGSRHLLEGLIKFSTREPWVDRFEEILEDHLIPACDETGLEVDDVVETIGQDLFTTTVWACAFEDFLTREFDDGENVVDDYLKRRGWKESASVRAYMAALRDSTMSLYEVSDIVRGSFRARDLIRGGEPVQIIERSATESLKPWDRIAARVVQVGAQMQIAGGVLAFDHETSEAFLETFRRLDSLSIEEKREIAEAAELDFDEDAVSELSPTDRLRAVTSMFTTFWLIDVIDRVEAPEFPELHNSEGDELVLCEVSYPLAADTTSDDIRAALQTRPDFHSTSPTSWSWVEQGKPAAARLADGEAEGRSLSFETWLDDGALVLGNIRVEEQSVVLNANSRQRCDRGCALLSDILGPRVGQPTVKAESIEQIMASHDGAMPDPLDIPEEQQRAIIHDYMDRHYRDALDLPVAMLGGRTPRAAVTTDGGRSKVVDWLKMLENHTAKSADPNSPMAKYNFGWLWTELGVDELRR
ncbi:hypothetical protein HNR60_003952 [Rhodopseudomonas rhenobacensis]|uniref:Antitoxin Xre/MbcA/ParS-like toxin-binding domain-containing protein n=1 Tax=Rhodopseudomonas rhenobacensis TaxID=87461 RepID=A0A7W7Z713_9BRAD|nr:hypothetical protein [Rhodopseudomonas rhenobacensis]MBB5049178.1 hypothetical protein [Rhodopseudomonas rhenobacensis]